MKRQKSAIGLSILAIFGFAIFAVGKTVVAKRSGYHVKYFRVHWGVHPVREADVLGFKGFYQKNGKPFPWGRDATGGFYRNLRVRNSHAPSFEPIDERVAKDRNNVYVGSRHVIGGAGDPTGTPLPSFTTQKGRGVRVLKEADATTFKKCQTCYVDKNHVFLPGFFVLENADPATFRVLTNKGKPHYNYYADAAQVFYGLKPVEHADPKTMRRDKVDRRLMVDNQFVYFKGKRLESTVDGKIVPARSSSWRQFPGTEYLTDGRILFRPYVYTPIEDADAATWEVFGQDFKRGQFKGKSSLDHMYAKDADHVWYGYGGCEALPEADSATFVYLGDGYAKDKNQVWHHGKRITGADPASFKLPSDGRAVARR